MLENSNKKKTNLRKASFYLMTILIVIFVILVVSAAKWKTSLQIEYIEIDGARILPHQLLLSAVNVPMQSLLDTVDLYIIKNRLLKQPYISSVNVNRKYPDGLRIQISERKPIASIWNGQLFYIDTAGILLPVIESEISLDLPIITGISDLKPSAVGTKLSNKEIETAIKILQTSIVIDTSLYVLISEVNMNSGNDIIITTTEPAVSIILGREDYATKLFIFQSFWSNFLKSNDVKKVQHIDLRYRDQVVVKWINDIDNQQKMF